jgi:hypothetical protein
MQVINIHLAKDSKWEPNKEVYYVSQTGDLFSTHNFVDLRVLQELIGIPFYVFDTKPTEEGFLGVDKENNVLIFASKLAYGVYKYFVTDLGTLKTKCSYNPFASMGVFIGHYQACSNTDYAWRRPFLAFGKDTWLVNNAPPPVPPPPKPKYKWTLTSQGVAFQ